MTAPPPPAKVTQRERLPPGFAEVADLLGDGPLLALLEAHGGTRLYIPERVAAGDGLAILLGLRPAQRLVALYGRDTLTVPLCKPWRAARLRAEGLTYAAIGRRLGMHEQSVHRMLTQTEAGTRRRGEAAAQMAFPFGD